MCSWGRHRVAPRGIPSVPRPNGESPGQTTVLELRPCWKSGPLRGASIRGEHLRRSGPGRVEVRREGVRGRDGYGGAALYQCDLLLRVQDDRLGRAFRSGAVDKHGPFSGRVAANGSAFGEHSPFAQELGQGEALPGRFGFYVDDS